jgi:hypothetical protein
MSYQAAKRRVLKERARRSQAGTPTRSGAPSRAATPTLGTNTPVYAGSIVDGNPDKVNVKDENIKERNGSTEEQDVKLSITDVSPIRPIWAILKQRSNVCILSASGAYLIDRLSEPRVQTIP